MSILLAGFASRSAATDDDALYYLAVGGSSSVGFQPTLGAPHGEPTDHGYANDLLSLEADRWPRLQLVHTGCPGETTETMLQGGDRCYPGQSSQLEAVVSFLRDHPTSTALVTIDIGFNDISRCLRFEQVDGSCVTEGLDSIEVELPRILGAIQAVIPPTTELVGLNHYDPFLAYLRGSAQERAFALQSASTVDQLDDLIDHIYEQHKIAVADVQHSFSEFNVDPSPAGPGVAQVCALTWMCATQPLGPNPHPNDAGYRVMASAIATAINRG